jgi:hypothetical protein
MEFKNEKEKEKFTKKIDDIFSYKKYENHILNKKESFN